MTGGPEHGARYTAINRVVFCVLSSIIVIIVSGLTFQSQCGTAALYSTLFHSLRRATECPVVSAFY